MHNSIRFVTYFALVATVLCGCKNETPERLRLPERTSDVIAEKGMTDGSEYGPVILYVSPDLKCSDMRFSNREDVNKNVDPKSKHSLSLELKNLSIEATLEMRRLLSLNL